MRIHRHNGPPGPPAGRAGHPADTPARRLRWRARHRRARGNAEAAPGSAAGGHRTARVRAAPGEIMAAETMAAEAAPGESLAAAMQLAIALLTAGLDSPELEARAAGTLAPADADGLADFMAGLHVISALLLNELHEATGEPPAAVLQRLAILAERQRGTPSAG